MAKRTKKPHFVGPSKTYKPPRNPTAGRPRQPLEPTVTLPKSEEVKPVERDPADESILQLVRDYALAFNKFGISIDIETFSHSHRVIFEKSGVEVVVHYRVLMSLGMLSVLGMFHALPPKNVNYDAIFYGLDPAERRAITRTLTPMTDEALGDADGNTGMTPEKWMKAPKRSDVQAEVDREVDEQRERLVSQGPDYDNFRVGKMSE